MHYKMMHCLDAKSTHFSTILAIPFSLFHTISQVWPLGTHCAIQHPGYWRKNQMALNFKWLMQPFFALGDFGDFQYADSCFVSRSYANIQVSPQVITDFNKLSSFRVQWAARPHTKTPKGHFRVSLFYLIVIFISCIRPLLWCLALWTSLCVTRQLGCWP